MAIKKVFQVGVLSSCLLVVIHCYAQGPYPGQTLQINTYLQSIIGKPSWTLIIRDADSQRVFPYLFDFSNNNTNFWLVLTTGRSYIVTASKMQWGPFAVIHDFCHLESGIITGQSLFITLKGELSPDPHSFKCYVEKYNDMPFPIVEQNNNS